MPEARELVNRSETCHWVEWPSAPEKLQLDAGAVHIWVANLDVSPRMLERLQATLTSDEIVRALRYREPLDRWRSLASHGVLRDILARYLRRRPDQFEFRQGALGKPMLASEELRFNLSHSAGVAVYAVAHDQEVGIDVEKIEPDLAGPEIAQRFFSPREAASIMHLPLENQVEGFFDCWTREEAYLKARGKGLSVAPDRVDVAVLSAEPEVIEDGDGAIWTRLAFRPIPGFQMAVAAEGTGWSMTLWGWGGFAVSEGVQRIGICEDRFSHEDRFPEEADASLTTEDFPEAAPCSSRFSRITRMIH